MHPPGILRIDRHWSTNQTHALHQPIPNFSKIAGCWDIQLLYSIERNCYDRRSRSMHFVKSWPAPGAPTQGSFRTDPSRKINKVCLSFWTYHLGHSSDRDPTSKKYQMVFSKDKQILFNTALISTKIVYLSGTLTCIWYWYLVGFLGRMKCEKTTRIY